MNTVTTPVGASWGWMLIRGLAAVLFGLLALLLPGATLVTLALLWGAYALVEGSGALIAAFRLRAGGQPLWPLGLAGLLGIVAGLITLIWPGLTALTLLLLIAVWAITMGILEIIAAIRLRQVITNEWWLGLSGLLSLAFGGLLVVNPGAGALAVIWLIGGYALLFGILLIALAWRLKRFQRAA